MPEIRSSVGRIETTIRQILCRERDPQKLLRDVAEMRERIERERKAQSVWDSKHLRGGLVDIEFLAQYLQLRHAAERPDILSPSSEKVFSNCSELGLLPTEEAEHLIAAHRCFAKSRDFCV